MCICLYIYMTINFIFFYICIHVYFYIPWTHCPFSKHWCRCKVIFPSLEASAWVHFKTPQLLWFCTGNCGYGEQCTVHDSNRTQHWTRCESKDQKIWPVLWKKRLFWKKWNSAGDLLKAVITSNNVAVKVPKMTSHSQPKQNGSLLSHVWSPIFCVFFHDTKMDLLVQLITGSSGLRSC